MKITMFSTDVMTEVDGRQCRVWRGVTERGIACDVCVPLLRVRKEADQAQFEQELKSMPEPRLPAVSFRHIW